MYKINSLNYSIICSSKASYQLLNFAEKRNFKGSTTLFFIFSHLFFKYSYQFLINDKLYIWPIDGISDFRLLRGDYVLEKNAYSLEIGYEGYDLNFIKKLINKNDIIIDLGANKGFYTLYFSSIIGDDGNIIAIEADAKNYNRLHQRVTKIWNVKSALVLNYILGMTNDQRVVLAKPNLLDDGTGFFLKNSNSKELSASFARRFDSLFANLINKAVKLIKIDVEGAEYLVLNGAEKTLQITEFIFVEVSGEASSRFGFSITDLYNYLRSNGFRFSYLINQKIGANPELIEAYDSPGNILFAKNKLV